MNSLNVARDFVRVAVGSNLSKIHLFCHRCFSIPIAKKHYNLRHDCEKLEVHYSILTKTETLKLDESVYSGSMV